MDFPIIDCEGFHNRDKTSKEISHACGTWGFFVLKGHGIPQEQVDRMFQLSAKFFALDKSVKAQKMMNEQQFGYDTKTSG